MTTWTGKDLEKLKEHYLSGDPLKTIARKLDRTPTAINKALSRFHIRSRLAQTSSAAQAYTPKRKYNQLKGIKKSLLPEIEAWVPMDTVLRFLEKAGHHIKRLQKQGSYIFDGKYLTNLQILMQANGERLEKKMLPFKVKEVTYEY